MQQKCIVLKKDLLLQVENFFSTGRVGLKLLLLFYLLSWCSEAENNFEKIFSNVSVMAKMQLVALIKKTRPQGHQQMYTF